MNVCGGVHFHPNVHHYYIQQILYIVQCLISLGSICAGRQLVMDEWSNVRRLSPK